MALLLYNYSVTYGVTLPKDQDKTTFSDDGSISSSAKRTAVYALQQAGVINGMETAPTPLRAPPPGPRLPRSS